MTWNETPPGTVWQTLKGCTVRITWTEGAGHTWALFKVEWADHEWVHLLGQDEEDKEATEWEIVERLSKIERAEAIG